MERFFLLARALYIPRGFSTLSVERFFGIQLQMVPVRRCVGRPGYTFLNDGKIFPAHQSSYIPRGFSTLSVERFFGIQLQMVPVRLCIRSPRRLIPERWKVFSCSPEPFIFQEVSELHLWNDFSVRNLGLPSSAPSSQALADDSECNCCHLWKENALIHDPLQIRQSGSLFSGIFFRFR